MGCLLCCPRKPNKQCDLEQNSVQIVDENNRPKDKLVLRPENLVSQASSISQSRIQINHQRNKIITQEKTQQNVNTQQKAAQQCISQIEEEKRRIGLNKASSISQSRIQINHHQQNKIITWEITQQKAAQQYISQIEEGKRRSSLNKTSSISQTCKQIHDQQNKSVQNTSISCKQIEQKRNEKLNTKILPIIELNLCNFKILSDSPVSYIPLRRNDAEFLLIYSKISRKDNFIVHKIERIENIYLLNSYRLKAEQKKQQFPQLKEELLFHGSSKNVVDKICTMGFDWRYTKEHKFGKGISFSTNSTYASVYSDECYDKVMLMCNVLVGNCCPGNNRMIIPSDQFDTSLKVKPNGTTDKIVTVKYDDGEFYPAFKIYYHLNQPNQRRVRNNRRR